MPTASTELIQSVRHYEVWSELAWADTVSRYRRTTIGPFWMTLSMSAMVGSVGVVYAGLFGNELTHYLPFLAVGMIVWTFLSSCIIEGCAVFTAAAGYIKSVPLPLTAHIFRLVARHVIFFAHNAVLILFMWLIIGWNIGFGLILALLGLAIDLVALVGLVLLFSILSTRFRDIPQIISAVMQLLFLLTPIVWMPGALKSPRLAPVIDWNPIYYLIEVVRGPLLGQPPSLNVWIIASLLALACLAVGTVFYGKFRHRVAYWL